MGNKEKIMEYNKKLLNVTCALQKIITTMRFYKKSVNWGFPAQVMQ